MLTKTKILILILFFVHGHFLFGQIHVQVIPDSTCPERLTRTIFDADSTVNINQLSKDLYENGFPFSSIDSSSHNIKIQCGPEVNIVGVSINPPRKASPTQIWDYSDWHSALQSRNVLLLDLADQGFPYARLDTRFQKLSEDTLFLNYDIDSLQPILIQEISVRGNLDIHPKLFQKMIGIKEEDRFSWSKINQSESIIKNWGFAEFQELNYDFNPFGMNLEYVIDEQNPSKFDVLIALVPSNRPNQQYELTGNAYLDLSNQLKLAERIFIQYDKYANQSQSFELQLNFPYIPFINAGIITEGILDRRDTTLLDVSGRIGVQYQWNPQLKYAVFLQQEQSRLVTVDSELLSQTKSLPEQLDYNWSALGTSLSYSSLNHPQNPVNGSLFKIDLVGGLKKIIQNASILETEVPNDEFSFSNAYDSLRQNTFKLEISGSLEKYIPVGKYSTLRLRTLGGWNFSSGGLLENEKFRVGGFQNYRGFPEKIFFADWYGMGSAEFRFLFDGESNAYLFSDFGLFGNKSLSPKINYPYSFGIGLNLGTKAGIFGISYALGGHRDQRISLSEGRVNFGLVVNY